MSRTRLTVALLAAATALGAVDSAASAPATGKVKVTVRGPQTLSVNVTIRAGKTRTIVSKAAGIKTTKPTLTLARGQVTLAATRTIYDGVVYEPTQRTLKTRIGKGKTARLEVTFKELATARKLGASSVTQTSVALVWEAAKKGAVQLRRAEGELAPNTTSQGTSVAVQGAGATDRGLRPGTRYSYGLFTKLKGKWMGPITVSAVTASPDPQAAAYAAPPSTTIVRPGDPDIVSTDGRSVTVQLAPSRKTPPIGAGFVLPTSAILPGGFLGRVTAISSDGRTVTLEPAGIGDAFDYYEISRDLGDIPPITLTPAPTASGARAKRAVLPAGLAACLGASAQQSINFKPVAKPKGHFKGSFVKRFGVPVGANFDVALAFEVGLKLDAEVKLALECGVPFVKAVVPIAATPVPIIAVFDPSIKASFGGAGKVQEVGYTVTSGFWVKGGIGAGGQNLQSGIIKDGGPTAINATAEIALGFEVSGELTVGPGVGSPVAGVVAGIGGQLTPLKASVGAVFPIADPRRSACLKASASAEAQLNIGAKAWLGNLSVSRTFTLDALKGEHHYGGPWYYPRNCEDLPAPKQPEPDPIPEPGMTRATVNWDSGADVDLHVWDPDGNHTYFRDLDAIPNTQLVEDVVPGFGPELFTTFTGKGDTYTFGICEYDSDGEEVTTVEVEITDPDGRKRMFTDELYFTRDAWMVTVSPAGTQYYPDPGWCDGDSDNDPTIVGNRTFDES